MKGKNNIAQIAFAVTLFGSLWGGEARAQTIEDSQESTVDEQATSVDSEGNLVYYDALEDGELIKQMVFADGSLGDPVVVRASRLTTAARTATGSDCRVVGCPTGLRCVRIALFGRNPYACRPPRAPVSAGPTVTITGGAFSGGPANLSQYLQK